MQITFSGIQPTGGLHLGHLFVLEAMKDVIDKKGGLCCIMDMHSITTSNYAINYKELAAAYLSLGIKPFIQSAIPEHAYLSWILSCVTPMGKLNRMTQFKTKKTSNPNLGLYSYPVLMAADVLLYKANVVPVGSDQKQHLELIADIAMAFNNIYGDFFPIPKPMINKTLGCIMSLRDASKKMSKSDKSDSSRINILDTPEVIMSKISKATTDSLPIALWEEMRERPEVLNLMNIFSGCTGIIPQEIAKQYQGVMFSIFKKELAQAVIKKVSPIANNMCQWIRKSEKISQILLEQSKKVRKTAIQTITEVKKIVFHIS